MFCANDFNFLFQKYDKRQSSETMEISSKMITELNTFENCGRIRMKMCR